MNFDSSRLQTFAQQPKGFGALAVIRVALEEIVFRNAVERGEDHVGGKCKLAAFRLERTRDRIDIDRVVIIRRGDAQRRLPAHPQQGAKRFIAGRRRSRGGILRIERDEQYAVAAAGEQRAQPVANRWFAVTHRPVGDDRPADLLQADGEPFALRPGDGHERQFISIAVPDLRVIARPPPRAGPQNETVANELPDDAAFFDHAWIVEELREIAPHRFRIGSGRRTEIDNQHANVPVRDRRMISGLGRRRARSAARIIRRNVRPTGMGVGGGAQGRRKFVVHRTSKIGFGK